MIVVGGAYLEECASPRFAGLFGPGLRAAITLTGLSRKVHLHTVAHPKLAEDIQATCDSLQIELTTHSPSEVRSQPIRFYYANALRPLVRIDGSDGGTKIDVESKDSCILLLGLLEAQINVTGRSVVYESRIGASSDPFANGMSRAERLGLVIKAQRFRELSRDQNARDVARKLLNETGAEVLVIRSELGGATVFQGDRPAINVGPYETKRWHRLGMGNVFSAVFAHYWAERLFSAEDAARAACRATALYNEGGSLPVPSAAIGFERVEDTYLQVPLSTNFSRPKVRLEGCNSRYVERQLFNDALDALDVLMTDVEVRKPLSDIDLMPEWSDDFSALLILSDFADGDAFNEAIRVAESGKPVISYAEYPRYQTSLLERIEGVEVVDDFMTAVYRTAVAARRSSFRADSK